MKTNRWKNKKISFFKDKTGKISTKEFRRLVFENEPLQGFRSETIDEYLNELSDQTGWINYEQFKKYLLTDPHSIDNPLVRIELKLAFNEVDTNKDGFISSFEARRGITLAGQFIPGISFNKITQIFDENQDGLLSYEEFENNIIKVFSSKRYGD